MRKSTDGIEASVAVGDLLLDATVILASTRLCADDAAAAERSGTVGFPAPGGRLAYLEVGGVIVAEGRMARKSGRSVFVVSRTYGECEAAS